VIEITGPTASGTLINPIIAHHQAKSELLLNVIVSFILPKTAFDTDLNGEETSIVYYDNDYHFDMFRLVQLLEQRISQKKIKHDKSRAFLFFSFSHFCKNLNF
jgi:hypothetical protein